MNTTDSMQVNCFVVIAVAMLAAGCGDVGANGDSGGIGGNTTASTTGGVGGSGSGGGPSGDVGFRPDVEPTGFSNYDKKGIANPGGKCTSKPGGTPMKLPVTGIEYCVKASVACTSPGASCPLYVTINTDGAYFPRVDDPANGDLIVVELYTETDGNGVKDKMAELPRVIGNDYAGLDRDRIYAIGWSAGAGAVTRGLCHISKKSDFSTIGTTSDIYAAVIAIGGCGCSNDYIQLSGNWHALTWNGMKDPFNGGDACEAGLRQRAIVNGCADPNAKWTPVLAEDPFAKNADGSTNAERLSFGACQYGDVTGYRFKDEAHVVSAKTHFNPSISSYDTVWRFLQGRVK